VGLGALDFAPTGDTEAALRVECVGDQQRCSAGLAKLTLTRVRWPPRGLREKAAGPTKHQRSAGRSRLLNGKCLAADPL